MYENLKNFKNLKEKKNQNSALYSTQLPPDNWAGVLDHLAIGLVDTKYTKLGKIGEKLLLILGLAHINFPLCYSGVNKPLEEIGEVLSLRLFLYLCQ